MGEDAALDVAIRAGRNIPLHSHVSPLERRAFARRRSMEAFMLGWAIVFAVLALAAAYLGFGALAGMAAAIAKILFVIFLVLLVLSFVMRAFRGRSVT